MVRISKYLIPCIVLILIIGFKKNIVQGMAIVFIHEMIHLIAARKLGYTGFTIDLLPIGTSLKFKDLDEATPKEDIIISLAGPVGNLLIAAVVFIIYRVFGVDQLRSFAVHNIVIGTFNLIPAFPLDGGRVLRDMLNYKFLYKKANKIALNISILIGYLFGAVFLISLFYGNINLNMAFIAAFVLFVSYKERRRIPYLIMGYILKKREKLVNRGYLENKSLSVYYKLNILELIELIDKNKYNEFIVLNKDMKVIGILYEEDVLNGIKELGNITLEELLEINNELK